MASERDYALFYDFALGLLQETVTKPNFLSYLIKTSFDDIEILSVSIGENDIIEWQYAVWDHRKDLDLYFSEHSAVIKYRYQILKPNPTIFFSKGTLSKEAYSNTFKLFNNKEYPLYDESVSFYGIDGTTYVLNLVNVNEYGWWCDLPDVYTAFQNTLIEIENNMDLGRQMAIQKII